MCMVCGHVFHHFGKGNYFCDYLSASLEEVAFPKGKKKL